MEYELHVAEDLEASSTEARNSVGNDTDELSENAVVASDVEDTDSDCSPHAVHQVNRESTDRVVQMQAVEHEHRTDNEHASDGTDNPGGERAHHVGTGRDCHETGKASVEGHGGVRLLRDNPARERRGNDTGNSSEVRGHKNPASGLRVARESRTGVESVEPARSWKPALPMVESQPPPHVQLPTIGYTRAT